MDEEIDRWFDFVEEYYKNNTAPLGFVLCPNSSQTGLRTPGAFSWFNGTRRELDKLLK